MSNITISEEKIDKEKELGLVDLMIEGDPCNPNLILNKLKGIRLWSDKKNFLSDNIDKCIVSKKPKRTKNDNSKKIKRKMSWYNACIKDNGKEAMTSGQCKKDNLSESEVEKWQKRADELNG